jgi:hypothetical protein
LAREIEAAGGDVTLALQPGMDHNRPIVLLAAPFRRDTAMRDLMARFASSQRSLDEVSVPVQPQTR